MNQLINHEEVSTQAIGTPWIRAGKSGKHHPLAEYLGVSPRTADKVSKELKKRGLFYKIETITILRKKDVDAYISGELDKEPVKGGE